MIISMNKKKSRSYDQAQLKNLSDLLCDDIENLLNSLEIQDFKLMDKMVSMSCPIHGGDNGSAFNLYHQGDSYRGNWKCRTHNCEQIFKSSILGFIRGCLSRNEGWSKLGDPIVSFNQALQYAIDFSKYDPASVKISRKHKEKSAFVNTIKHVGDSLHKELNTSNGNIPKIPRQSVIRALKIPSSYFIDRGFSSEILIKYDVGDCIDTTKEMFDRAVVPVYDTSGQFMVGCTGRSVFNKHEACGCYHNVNKDCPRDTDQWKHSKWKHNKNFKTQDHLYNFWYAQKYIEKSKTVIIVESPGNVWRLEEAGIHNSVAIFGSSMHQKQKMLLDISGAMSIITIMDNDDAGRAAAANIESKCSRTYNVYHLSLEHSDVAEMTVDEVKNIIIPQLNIHESIIC